MRNITACSELPGSISFDRDGIKANDTADTNVVEIVEIRIIKNINSEMISTTSALVNSIDNNNAPPTAIASPHPLIFELSIVPPKVKTKRARVGAVIPTITMRKNCLRNGWYLIIRAFDLLMDCYQGSRPLIRLTEVAFEVAETSVTRNFQHQYNQPIQASSLRV